MSQQADNPSASVLTVVLPMLRELNLRRARLALAVLLLLCSGLVLSRGQRGARMLAVR
jgi:hypothetical protein